MKPLNLIMATLLTSFVYFGLLKYESNQEPNMMTGFIIVSSSLIFAAVMIVILLEAAKIESSENKGGQE
jgi:hypothetical protein